MANTSIATGPRSQEKALGATLSALVIGIDNYKHKRITYLRGAVNDARAVKAYLREYLGVPDDHITYLENHAATRDNIIQGFQQLNRHGLARGSPVLIYFAGHGARVQVGGKEQDYMEAMIPYDCDTFSREKKVHPILDKTVSDLIESLHNQIGDNITVILDCCHSGSVTRGMVPADAANVRRVHIPESYQYPQDLDSRLLAEILPNGSLMAAEATHVVLAACGARELAEEAPLQGVWQGVFTKALLDLLKTTPIDCLTPADIATKVEITRNMNGSQTPLCRGQNRERFLFGNKAFMHTWYRVQATWWDGNVCYTIDGGYLHGISEHATFKLFRHRNADECLGAMQATDVQACTSVVEPVGPWPATLQSKGISECFGRLDNVGNVTSPRLFIEERTSAKPISHALGSLSGQTHQVKFVPANQYSEVGPPPCLALKEETDGTISLANCDSRLSFASTPDYLSIRVPSEPKEIRNVLKRAAHFFYHLDNASAPRYKPNGIEIKILELSSILPRIWRATNRTAGEYLEDGRLSITEKPNARYGINIRNQSIRPWFVTLLYFDGAKHKIEKWYGPGSAGQHETDCCLPNGDELKLGYGGGLKNIRPIIFYVPEGRQRDFAVLKFIFTTKPVDFGKISSESTLLAESTILTSRAMMQDNSAIGDSEDDWGTISLPIVVCKGKRIN